MARCLTPGSTFERIWTWWRSATDVAAGRVAPSSVSTVGILSADQGMSDSPRPEPETASAGPPGGMHPTADRNCHVSLGFLRAAWKGADGGVMLSWEIPLHGNLRFPTPEALCPGGTAPSECNFQWTKISPNKLGVFCLFVYFYLLCSVRLWRGSKIMY